MYYHILLRREPSQKDKRKTKNIINLNYPNNCNFQSLLFEYVLINVSVPLSKVVSAHAFNMVVRQRSGENHSRRHRNKRARVANSIVALVFLMVFLFSLISFGTFLEKHRQIFDKTIYGTDANDTYGHCVLYADPVGDDDTVYPRIHLGRSGACISIVYGELFVAVYALVMTFVLFFKVVIGCP